MSKRRAALAVLIIWIPYIASTALQERLGQDGPLGPALMLFALLMCWPAARLLGDRDPFARGDTFEQPVQMGLGFVHVEIVGHAVLLGGLGPVRSTRAIVVATR